MITKHESIVCRHQTQLHSLQYICKNVFFISSSILLEIRCICWLRLLLAAKNSGIFQFAVKVIAWRSCKYSSVLLQFFFALLSLPLLDDYSFGNSIRIYLIQKQNSHIWTLAYTQRHCGSDHFRFDDIYVLLQQHFIAQLRSMQSTINAITCIGSCCWFFLRLIRLCLHKSPPKPIKTIPNNKRM